MIAINMTDVLNVVSNCMPYLIGLAVVLLAGIITMIAVSKVNQPLRKMIRSQSLLAMLLAFVVVINLVCFSPTMSTMLSLITNEGTISEESYERANALCAEIEKEGIVLLKNKDNALPLRGTNKLNVFGWASTNPVYAGTGSGALSDVYPKVTLLDGIASGGFELNTELSDFYTAYQDTRPAINGGAQDWTMPEPPVNTYSEELLDNARSFSDTAIIVFSRSGGEGMDVPTDMAGVIDGSWQNGLADHRGTYTNNSDEYADFVAGQHYLELSKTEENLVNMVCENFKNVVVVYNGSNTMELGWVDEHPEIKSVLWCAGAGQSGFSALGEVLNGTVNPSGKTTDTFVYDLTATPTWNNFGSFIYDNMAEYNNVYEYYGYLISETWPSFVNYVEGIYVGYRFYETAAKEGLIDYDKTVQYPFGYGLSYTSFEQTMGQLSEHDGVISFDVTVTNTGDVAGKDVVEVYYEPPYTNGGIEKASANLVAFDKTRSLEPGESEQITISFPVEDMASYDESGTGHYVLEQGGYAISINRDSHTMIDSQTYTVDSTIFYDEGSARSTDGIAAKNLFDTADGGLTYLSRADGFANYDEATKAPESLTMPAELKAQFLCVVNYDASTEDNPDDVMPVTGASGGPDLAELRGVSYDDPQWDQLLDRLTVEEMDVLISQTGYQTQAISSIGKVSTTECDGPVAINNSFTGGATIGFPPAVVIANSWNTELAYDFGDCMGVMAGEMDVDGWYAPAMNTHRSAFGGRNFEYYSEDGHLAGKIAAQVVAGAQSQGVYTFIKHFALNDQDSNRLGMLCTWSNEQAIREIYLKPFEIAVKEGKSMAVMAALNYIGPVAAAATDGLMNGVLRDEWGFRGMVITDYFGMYGYQNADQQVRNGTDGCLVAYEVPEAHVRVQSATGVQAMRTASHNILYTVVNSRAYENGGNISTPVWTVALYAVDAVFALAIILLEVRTIMNYRKRTHA